MVLLSQDLHAVSEDEEEEEESVSLWEDFNSSVISLAHPFPQKNAFLGLFQYSYSSGRTEDSRLIPLIGLYLNCVK